MDPDRCPVHGTGHPPSAGSTNRARRVHPLGRSTSISPASSRSAKVLYLRLRVIPRASNIRLGIGTKRSVRMCAYSAASTANEVIGTVGQLAEKNQNRLIVEALENLGALTADSMRLKQILLNLLSNACKFTKEGEVALRVRKVADGRDWVELAVA